MAPKLLRRRIAATTAILVALLTGLARAGTNYSDMWFNASESGWGVNFTQDYNGPIFATFFVYAANGAPTWVVGILNLDSGTGVYSGTLYETADGAPLTSQSFDPAAVTTNDVGTASFTPANATHGTLAYTYRGSVVTKQIAREPLYTAATAGNATFLTFTSGGTAYRAIFESRNNGLCSASYPGHKTNGATWRIFPTAVTTSSITFNIGACDSSVTDSCVISAPFCSFTGAITVTGRVLSVSGTMNCTEGQAISGGLTGALTATFYEIERTDPGFNGKLFVTNGSCNAQSIVLIQHNGWLTSQIP